MKWIEKIWIVFRFVIKYLYDLARASLIIAWDILTPGLNIHPGVVAIPMKVSTDQEILTLVNLISMTPGSLSVDISKDRKFIFVHGMYMHDVEKFKDEIKDLERRVMEIYR
ncbi:MAG: Na+/H+ antiporter subunit E [Bacteroidales bacterium]